MSSTPVTPVTTTTTAKPVTPVASTALSAPIVAANTLVNDLAWLRTHAIILLVFIALLVGGVLGTVALVQHFIEIHDEHAAAAQQKKEGVDTSAQAALVAELAKEHSDDQARDAQEQATINSLIAQMAAGRAQTAKQVTTDGTLDAKDAAARLTQQTKTSPSDVTVGNDNVTMSLPLTRIVIADLDNYAQAQSDVTNLTGQLGAQTILTNDAKVELGTANKIIAQDKTDLVATVKADNDACNVRVDKERTAGNKRTFWGALIGGIIGFAVRK